MNQKEVLEVFTVFFVVWIAILWPTAFTVIYLWPEKSYAEKAARKTARKFIKNHPKLHRDDFNRILSELQDDEERAEAEEYREFAAKSAEILTNYYLQPDNKTK